MQPRPEIAFTRDGWKQDLRCTYLGPSSLYQRWNLQMRKDQGMLTTEAMPTNEFFSVLLITRASKILASTDGKFFEWMIVGMNEIYAIITPDQHNLIAHHIFLSSQPSLTIPLSPPLPPFFPLLPTSYSPYITLLNPSFLPPPVLPTLYSSIHPRLSPPILPTLRFIVGASKDTTHRDKDNSPSARGMANVPEIQAMLEGLTPPEGR